MTIGISQKTVVAMRRAKYGIMRAVSFISYILYVLSTVVNLRETGAEQGPDHLKSGCLIDLIVRARWCLLTVAVPPVMNFIDFALCMVCLSEPMDCQPS
jgi:hypothetical protein